MRRRPPQQATEEEAAPADATPADADASKTANDAPPADSSLSPRKWHEFLSVRVVLFLLVLFAMLHLFLWKIVYDFWMSQNHDRLRGTVREAVNSLYAVVEHL